MERSTVSQSIAFNRLAPDTQLEHRAPDVVADDRGEQRGVEAVERAAVGAEQPRRCPSTPASRLTKDSNRSPIGAAIATPRPSSSASRAREPVLVEARRTSTPATAATMPIDQPLDGLVRRDPRRERAAAEHAPAEVGAGVADERADEHVDDDRVAVRQLAQQHRVREREADPVDARAA